MRNIFGALKPLLHVSFLLGLGPFFVYEDPESLKVSTWKSVYTVVVLALYLGSSVIGVSERIHISKTSMTHIGEYSNLVLLPCGIVVALCTLVLTLIQRKKIASMVNNFHDIDGQMAKLDVHIPYDRIFRFSCLVIASLSVLLLGLVCHDYVTMRQMSVFFWVTYFGPVVFSTFAQCQFISGGLLLKKNYSSLNERLKQFGREKRLAEGDLKKIELIESSYGNYLKSHNIRKSSIPEIPVPAWESTFSRHRTRKIVPHEGIVQPTPLLIKIKIIRKIHSNLCETKELLNSSYSLQLLAMVAQAFVLITANLYSLFTKDSKAEKESISYPIIWACYRALELVCITVTCTKISKTANYTAVIVHRLLSDEWESNIRNQLLHRKISFSASGFFTLDMTLLHAIIGAATTYLVILVQFHNMYETS